MTILKQVICAALMVGLGSAVGNAADDQDDKKKSVWSTLDLQIYGYVKLDAAYDTDQANPGNFVKWIEAEPLNPNDSQFSMTANQTRLGLWLTGPESEEKSLLMKGRVEIDFYGGGAENKPRPMLRLAYVDLDWRNSGWRMVAGQTFDIISPLFPPTVNYSVQWWGGNIGYRRPQIQGFKVFDVSEKSRMQVGVAMTRDIGSTDSVFADVDAGTDAGVPGFQGRVGWMLGTDRPNPVSFGLSGHWSKESYELNELGDHEDFQSWSANIDLLAPLAKKVTLKSEAYTGANLAQYLGGIGQGVNLERNLEIGDTGGWITLGLGPYKRLTHHLGATVSTVDEEDIEAGDRSFNSSIFWNGVYEMNKHLNFALELSYWSTEYKSPEAELDSAENFRTQFAVIYRF